MSLELDRNKNCRTKKTLANINMLLNGRNDAITFMEDYSSMILEAKKKKKKSKEKDLRY